jgi:DNA-binding GntR family transcriptional regulator
MRPQGLGGRGSKVNPIPLIPPFEIELGDIRTSKNSAFLFGSRQVICRFDPAGTIPKILMGRSAFFLTFNFLYFRKCEDRTYGGALTPSTYRTMSEIAAEAIREAIGVATYPPGTRLVPIKLEKELGLGRTAIREALKELTCTGLVISVPNKGAVVAEPPQMDEVEQIFEIRYLLEGKAAYLATKRMTPDVLRRLEAAHERMCANSISGPDYFALNREFHLAIYQLSGWTFLYQIIVQLVEKVRLFRAYYPLRDQDLDISNRDHEEILSSLKKGDADRVSHLIATNVRRGFESLRAGDELRKERSIKIPRTSQQAR